MPRFHELRRTVCERSSRILYPKGIFGQIGD